MADGPVLQQGDGWRKEGGLKDDPAVPVHHQQQLKTKAAKSEELSFTEWLERYSIGRIGPADQAPLPPPSILAILNGREPPPQPSPVSTTSSLTSSPVSLPTSLPSPSLDSSPILPQISLNKPKRGPISLSITLSHGSSRASSAASIDSTSTGSLFNPAVTEEHATALLNHFREKGTFPAPPGPWEEERLRLAHKYGLDQPVRRKAIDRICAIAKAHFKTKMVVVSLTLDDHQVLGAERGFDPDGEPTLADPPRPLDIEPAFCTHAMAASYRDPKQVFLVADANKDWRFARNPYSTKNGGGVSFYAAANVNLPVEDNEKRGLPSTLASGALCLMDGTKTLRDPSEFSEEDRAVLSDLAEMIAREFQLGFEQRRREEESKQSEFLGELLQQALVQPVQPGYLRTANSDSSSSSNSRRSSPLNSLDQEERGELTSSAMDDRPFDFPSHPPTPLLPMTAISSDSPNLACPRTNSDPWDKERTDDNASSLAPSLFTTAAAKLIKLTKSESCGILDLRNFRSSHYQPQTSILRSSVSLSPTQANSFVPPFPSPSSLTASTLPRKDSTATPNSPRVGRTRTESYGLGGPGLLKFNRGKIGLMASQGNVDWRKIVKRSSKNEKWARERTEPGEKINEEEEEEEIAEDPLTLAVEETLRIYATMSVDEEDRFGVQGAFSAFSILPENTSDTYCVPIFDVDGSPALMIIVSSTQKWFSFEPTDRRFLQSIGAVLVGSLLRERARESDRAKLAFISQVSHEVRTPLYGVSSQLSLIREFSSPLELRKLAPLLDVAEICVDSLSSVLEDTLDFSKLSNSTAQEEASLRQRRLARLDLVTLIEGVLKSSWIKKKRADLASVDLGGVLETKRSEEEQEGKIDLILEVEDKEDGWEVLTDGGGLRRVLLNIVGNALKFTRSGHVKVTLRYLGRATATTPDITTPRPRRSSFDQPSYRGHVVFAIEDTGIGMSSEFLREGALFTPFKQADSFSSGVGLGLSICDSIVKRLGPGRIDVSSELGVGTEISVTLPLDFIGPQQSSTNSFPFNLGSMSRPQTSTRRVISNELDDLFSDASKILPQSPAVSKPPSRSSAESTVVPQPATTPIPPPSKPPSVDFPSAVAALHVTLSAVPESEGQTNNSPDELAIEAAKLAISTTQQVESSVIPMSSPEGLETNGDPLTVTKEVKAASLEGMSVKGVVKAVEKKLEAQRKVSIAPDIHVLFADDNPVARNILTKLFTGKGIKFSAAEDGQQAVDMFVAAQGAVSLILMDVQMPIMDGIAASHAIRAIEIERTWERCRIIALTGLSNESDIAEAVSGGVDKWLVKGGKSLRAIMDEVVEVQQELEERRREEENGV
ncbi:hypothetical protein JCM5350_006284 [Sporobolomyces pararoseus]